MIKTGSKNCGHLSLSLRPPTSSQPRGCTLSPITQFWTVHLPVVDPAMTHWLPLWGCRPLGWSGRLSGPGTTAIPCTQLPSIMGPHFGPSVGATFNPQSFNLWVGAQPLGSWAQRIMGDLSLGAGAQGGSAAAAVSLCGGVPVWPPTFSSLTQ